MKKDIKLSYASSKSKLNGVDISQELGAFSMGTGTGTGSYITYEEQQACTSSTDVSYSKDDVCWTGNVVAHYVVTIVYKIEDGVLKRYPRLDVDSCNFTYSFRGSISENAIDNGRVIIEGLETSGSISSGMSKSITFIILRSTYIETSAGEQLSSTSRTSSNATLSVEDPIINSFGDVNIIASLS